MRSSLDAQELRISVHKYACDSTTPSPSLDAEIIDQGQHILHQASSYSTKVWFSVTLPEKNISACTLSNCFEFAPKPPRLPYGSGVFARFEPALREWDTEVDDFDDLYTVDELEDFVSSAAGFTMVFSPPSRDSPPIEVPPEFDVSGADLPSLIEPFELDTSDISEVIPFPPILPTSYVPSPPYIGDLPSYSKVSPKPIPPHTPESIAPASTPHRRGAWVIPIRGTLDWEGASSAAVLSPASMLSMAAPPKSSRSNPHRILWDHVSLRAFWNHLTRLHGGQFAGLIGLSCHLVPISSPPTPVLSPPALGRPYPPELDWLSQPHISLPGEIPSLGERAPKESTPQKLTMVDHIKVYHDRAHSMILRNVLDEWEYEAGDGQKCFLLDSARLVLVDERSHGILMC